MRRRRRKRHNDKLTAYRKAVSRDYIRNHLFPPDDDSPCWTNGPLWYWEHAEPPDDLTDRDWIAWARAAVAHPPIKFRGGIFGE